MYLKLILISKIALLALLCITRSITVAQKARPVSLNIADHAPSLQVQKWLKGSSLQRLEKGKIYLLEFWATWCKPCKAAMPQLSMLARRYKDKLTVIGIDVYEKNTPVEKVKEFVESMGDSMDYNVAIDKNKFMETSWVIASGNEGIPKTIIVNADGKIAWIGHPKDLEQVVPKILDNTWDIKKALIERNLTKYLKALDDSMNFELLRFRGNYDQERNNRGFFEPEDAGNPDSALYYIDKIIKQEPRLRYKPLTAFNTLYSLLKIDPQKASEYGKKALFMTSSTDDSPSYTMIGAIEICSYKLQLPAQIYELGAEAYQVDIRLYPYPDLVNISKQYHKMAWWYWLAKKKQKAIEAEQNAISTLKSRDFVLPSELSLYEAQLKLYNICNIDD